LWLEDTLRLGPPAIQHGPDLLAPRVVLVDLLVDSVGPKDANYVFAQKVEELSAFLSVVLDRLVHLPPQNRRSWTYTFTTEGKPVCDVRWLGYIEVDVPAQMPVRDAHKLLPMHAVTRPNFSLSVNNFVGAQELSLPADIVDLWQAYRSLSPDKHRQFLQVAAKWQEALQARDRPTLSFALMVVACEALKPSHPLFHRHNINHVVEALLGKTIATRLKNDDFRAQYKRSVHLHLGEFLGPEFRPGSMVSRFHDPTFEQAHRELADIVQAAIIEWLRSRGDISMPALKRARLPSRRRP
jgi:hypothetical protein